MAQRIKAGIHKYLWQPDKGYFAQYLYGRNYKIVSPRAEALGEALCVLFGIAEGEKATQLIRQTPVMDFGIPCIYPQISNIPPYHNNAVWPFVQSYWALAAGTAGNENAVMESFAAIYRPAALWVTNKENFVASNGDFAGTVINSSNMLWSLSGSLALVHKILFGLRFDTDGLRFQPFVPEALNGERSLTNFRYRNAVLAIQLEGYGKAIQSFLLDGKPSAPFIAKDLKGKHTVKIILNNQIPSGKINLVAPYTTLNTPITNLSGNRLSWDAISGAKQYRILKNGKELAKTTTSFFPVTAKNFSEYQVIAVDENGVESFASEPVMSADARVFEFEKNAEKSSLSYKGFSGEGFVEISKEKNTTLTIPVNISEAGVYALDFRYANGNGPINTENKCAIRSLYRKNAFLGAVVLPQRGTGEWSNWGWSNPVQTRLQKGQHVLTLRFEPSDENMNGEINQAMLDYVRVVKIR